jgi:hypothetical protein
VSREGVSRSGEEIINGEDGTARTHSISDLVLYMKKNSFPVYFQKVVV